MGWGGLVLLFHPHCYVNTAACGTLLYKDLLAELQLGAGRRYKSHICNII